MADSDEREEGGDDNDMSPEALLPKVQKQAKLNGILMSLALVVSLLIVSTMGVAIYVMNDRIASIEAETLRQEEQIMNKRFAMLEERLSLLAEFRRSELKKIRKYTDKLTRVTEDCSIDRVAPFIGFLAEREKDFQQTIDVLKDGTISLARMNQGSKKWLSGFDEKYDDLKKKSSTRQQELDKLL